MISGASNGIDAFQQYQLPDAVIRLRQGCGRLLRRLSDRGVLMVADPRVHTKPYGQIFIQSLPDMEQMSTLAPISAFYENVHQESDEVISY